MLTPNKILGYTYASLVIALCVSPILTFAHRSYFNSDKNATSPSISSEVKITPNCQKTTEMKEVSRKNTSFAFESSEEKPEECRKKPSEPKSKPIEPPKEEIEKPTEPTKPIEIPDLPIDKPKEEVPKQIPIIEDKPVQKPIEQPKKQPKEEIKKPNEEKPKPIEIPIDLLHIS